MDTSPVMPHVVPPPRPLSILTSSEPPNQGDSEAVWNADSLQARPCRLGYSLESLFSPPGTFLRAVFNPVESSFHLESSSNGSLLSVRFL